MKQLVLYSLLLGSAVSANVAWGSGYWDYHAVASDEGWKYTGAPEESWDCIGRELIIDRKWTGREPTTDQKLTGSGSEINRSDEIGARCDALEGELPYHALIILPCGYCSASIIHERWLLTAAQCGDKIEQISSTTVIVGTLHRSGAGGTNYSIEAFIPHKDYNKETPTVFRSHDIALIRVDTCIQFNEKVRPVQLPKDNLLKFVDKLVVMSGWGNKPEDEGEYLAQPLQSSIARTIDNEQCCKHWNISDSHLCTSLEEKGLCPGDPGSPLVFDDLQVGIVSYLHGDCGDAKPNVHTRVLSFVPWIKDVLNDFSDEL